MPRMRRGTTSATLAQIERYQALLAETCNYSRAYQAWRREFPGCFIDSWQLSVMNVQHRTKLINAHREEICALWQARELAEGRRSERVITVARTRIVLRRWEIQSIQQQIVTAQKEAARAEKAKQAAQMRLKLAVERQVAAVVKRIAEVEDIDPDFAADLRQMVLERPFL